MVATYLQVKQSCHGWACLRPGQVERWSSVLSMLGAVAFLVGSAVGVHIPGLSSLREPLLVSLAYLAGSVSLLVGSYLKLPETFPRQGKQETGRGS